MEPVAMTMKTKTKKNVSRSKSKLESDKERKPAGDYAGNGGSWLGIKRILVPTDFSNPSLNAVKYAVRLAEHFGATIYLVYVIEKASFITGVDSVVLSVPESSLVAGAKKKLLSLATDEIEELVPVSPEVRIGKPFDEIVKLAGEKKTDLIIIATHGYTGLRHVLIGSTAERVVRHAPCPVLVVREQERDFI